MAFPAPVPATATADGVQGRRSPDSACAGFAPVLVVTVTLALAACLLILSALLSVIHPAGSGFISRVVIGQNQRAKTVVYLLAFAVVLPGALILVPRLLDRWVSQANAVALPALAALLCSSLAIAVLVVRVSRGLPWGDGLATLLAAILAWWLFGSAVLRAAMRDGQSALLRRITEFTRQLSVAAGVLVFGTSLSVTDLGALSPIGLALGIAVLVAVFVGYGRIRLPRPALPFGRASDVIVVGLLVLAIPNVVVFTSTGALPNIYFEPGVIQFQQDWMLGPTNQLLSGGALLVNDPSSQYGVGLVYFLALWFHVAPIGYGTFGLLDGILTACLYIAGYAVMRIAGVGRLLAGGAIAFGVTAFIYHLVFAVGELPEQGPLRFGMPMLVIVSLLVAVRSSRASRLARPAAFAVVGVAAIWSIEAAVYTTVTFVAMTAMHAFLRPAAHRWRWLTRQLAMALGFCLLAHIMLAICTLVAVGRLPDWTQYLDYVRSLVLGGREGSITYAFARWSPALLVGAAYLASAAAVVLLAVRKRQFASQEGTVLMALAGTSVYGIASFSYIDNRSSTYLLLYVALPVLITGVLWVQLIHRGAPVVSIGIRRSAFAFALSIATITFAASWPTINSRFSRSALAHAYPGGGLGAALHRLWHPPPIDPRAPEGQRLLAALLPGRYALVVLPSAADLAQEILIRSRRSEPLFVGDPSQDAFVPSVWDGIVSGQIKRLPAGERLLTDGAGLLELAALHRHSAGYALAHPALGGNPELEWILHQIDLRFVLRVMARAPDGLVVAQLERR